VEDLRYADSGRTVEAPDFVPAIHNAALYHGLLAFAASKGISVTEQGLNGARGVSKLGEIGLQVGDPFYLRVAPLIHELGHELLHPLRDRLAATFGDERSSRLLEGEAEAVAAVVLGYLGHPLGMSAAYLRHWKVEPADILGSMQRIADVAGEIVVFIGAHSESAAKTKPLSTPVASSPAHIIPLAA
jgi:hypothetical protein